MALLLSVFMVVSSARVLAFEIKVVDQFNEPVVNAFVAVPEGRIQSVSSAPAVMDQINIQFSPHVLAIEQGREVIFPNSDNIRHHVYSFSEAKRFEIKLYEGVPKSPILFDKEGLVALGCNIHDPMLAYIYVSPWPQYTVTAEDGRVTFDGTTFDGTAFDRKVPRQIAIWHPWLKGLKEAVLYDLPPSDDDIVTVKLELSKPKPVNTFKNYRRRYND